MQSVMLSVGNGEPILAAALAPDQGTVAAVNNDLDIFVLDVETGDVRDTIPGPGRPENRERTP